MNLHHLKVSLRHLYRNKVYSLINLTGLSVGIASALLIALYVQNELSFDQFFEDSERIYRIPLHRIYPDRTRDFASSAITLAPVLKQNYPEVEAVTRLHRMFFVNELPVHIEDRTFIEPRFRFADEDFFEVFSHAFLHGNPKTALNDPRGVVITESTAIKYFGKTDVLNESIRVANDTNSTLVTGVIRDIPHNSHLHFDLLGSIHSVPYLVNAIENNRWMNPWVYTYVKLKEGIDPASFERKFDDMVQAFGGPHLAQNLGKNYAELGHKFEYILQPIQDIHLHSTFDIEVEPTSDINYVYLLALIGIIILLISSINYINLSVARSPSRAKEVGIRKVIGVPQQGLIRQFLTESVMMAVVSAVVALVIASLSLSYFNYLLHTDLSFDLLAHPIGIGIFLSFTLLIGLLSGIYPATVIASTQPARILKGSFKHSKRGIWLRNGLTTLQFVIALVMISGSMLVHQQMTYLQEKPLGFEQENVLIIQQVGQLGLQYEAFRNQLAALPDVVNAGGSNALPSDFHGSNIYKSMDPTASDLRTNVSTVDDHFFQTMKFELQAGRSFGPEFNDSLSVLINAATVQSLGLQEPVGTQFRDPSQGEEAPLLTVVGVVENYHFFSLHAEITPLMIFNGNQGFVPPKMAVRLRTNQREQAIDAVQTLWREFTEGEMNYHFLDQQLQEQYESDRSTAQLFDLFTFIALILCCTGLFGLTTFTAQQRLKEMSVRKVFGASIGQIVLRFSREFLLFIGIASLIGIPIAIWMMQGWLEGFAYHVDITVGLFALTVLVMVLLIAITVSYQSFKLGRINPVESLRNE